MTKGCNITPVYVQIDGFSRCFANFREDNMSSRVRGIGLIVIGVVLGLVITNFTDRGGSGGSGGGGRLSGRRWLLPHWSR